MGILLRACLPIFYTQCLKSAGVKLQQFEVKGYKNLTRTVTFGPLGRINVIHGENNVGKSNLLQAMDLYFRLLELEHSRSTRARVKPPVFNQLGHPIDEIFNFANLAPLEMGGTFCFTAEQQKRFGLEPLGVETVEIYIQASLQAEGVTVRIGPVTSGMTGNMLRQILTFLSKTRLLQAGKTSNRFVLLGVDRRLMIEDTTPANLRIVPQALRDALFDAKESREAVIARRWELFVEAMKQFEPILGPGWFSTSFDRPNNRADLVLDRGDVRIPVDLLGSGVQQIVALLGQLLLTPATLVGIEEPELNLRYTLQKQLLGALQEIVASEYGPGQLFLSSHSPAFEAEEHFFGMEIEDGAPVLTRRPRALARTYTGTRDEEDLYPEMHARRSEPACYVSSEGLVMLPENVRKALRVEHGGGVSFIPNKETGRLEMWTTDQVERWLIGDDGDDA